MKNRQSVKSLLPLCLALVCHMGHQKISLTHCHHHLPLMYVGLSERYSLIPLGSASSTLFLLVLQNSSSKLLPKGTPPALHLSNTPSARLIHEGELSPDSIDSPVLMSSSVPGPWSQPAPPPPTQSQSMYADFNASPKKESSHSSSNVNELLVDSYEQISPSQVLLQGTLPERKRTTSEEARMSDSDSFCDSLTSDLQDGLRLDPDPAAEVSPCLKADGGSVNSLYNDSCLDIRFRKKLSCHGGLEILLTLENVSGEEIEQLQGACLKLEAPNGVLAEVRNSCL